MESIYFRNIFQSLSVGLILLCSEKIISSSSSSNLLTSAFQELLVVQPSEFIQLQFPYNLNTDYVTTSTTGTGASVTQATNFAVLTTDATVASSATMLSNKRLHYFPGQGTVCMFSALFTTGIANTIQVIGAGNTQDGFFFGYNGASFGILQRVNSVDTWTAQTSWNSDKFNGIGASGITLDPTKGNVFKIQYQWLGFGVIKFFIENPNDGTFVLAHIIKYPNANTTASLLNPSVQLYTSVAATASLTPSVVLKTSCMSGMVEGKINPNNDTRNAAANADFRVAGGALSPVKNSSTALQSMLGLQNNTTFQTKTNQVVIYLDELSVMNDSSTDAIISLILNPTSVTGQSFTNINAATSVVSFDTAGTTITGGKLLMTFYCALNSLSILDLTDYGISLQPGDQLILAARTVSGSASVFFAVSWRERF